MHLASLVEWWLWYFHFTIFRGRAFLFPIRIYDLFEQPLTDRILEPSCGDGVFLESLIDQKVPAECVAIEQVTEEAEKAKSRTNLMSNIQVLNEDFFWIFNDKLAHEKFDLVLGNPPFIRYQYLSPEQREIQSKILINNGMKSNKLINSWVSFLVASVQLLSDEGRIAMVIPAELLQVAYAHDLRLFLTRMLSKITVITFEELVFPDVQQEIVLFLGEKSKGFECRNECEISIVQAKNAECLDNIWDFTHVEYKYVNHETEKWTLYLLNNKEVQLVDSIRHDDRFIDFSSIAKIDIGITTGNNKFFSVSKDVVNQYSLDSVTLPLIGRSSHAHGLIFTKEDWVNNVDRGSDAFLLNFPDVPFEHYPTGHKEYIQHGEEMEENLGYKCRIRERWYRVPSIWVPDAFFLRRNNNFPKFVLNGIDAVSTDTMHRLKFNAGISPRRALLSYYNSITLAFTEIEARSYGGGVLEILPGELERVRIPDLSGMDENTVDMLLDKIDRSIREKGDFIGTLNLVDKTVLIDFLGVDERTVKGFRQIWMTLMFRRQNRK